MNFENFEEILNYLHQKIKQSEQDCKISLVNRLDLDSPYKFKSQNNNKDLIQHMSEG
jgi:hypothetical protein